MKSIKRIEWLNNCTKCKCQCVNYNHYVTTSSTEHFLLNNEDKVVCGACDHTGEIEVFDGIAEVIWDGLVE